MHIQSPDPKPRSEGDYLVDPTPGYGKPTADIHLDEKGHLRLLWLDEGDCERLIRAAAEALKEIRRYTAQMTAPHGRGRIYEGRCQLCGKPEDDELHAEVITDSERTCTSTNPVTDQWCYKTGKHTQHFDPDGGTWTTFTAPDDDDESGEDATVAIAESSAAERETPLPLACGCTVPLGHLNIFRPGHPVVCIKHGSTTVASPQAVTA